MDQLAKRARDLIVHSLTRDTVEDILEELELYCCPHLPRMDPLTAQLLLAHLVG